MWKRQHQKQKHINKRVRNTCVCVCACKSVPARGVPFKSGKLVLPRLPPQVICRQNNMHTDDPITRHLTARRQPISEGCRELTQNTAALTQHTHTERKQRRIKHVAGKLSKGRGRVRRTDRQRDRRIERKGALSFSFRPYRMNRASVLLLCSNTPHGCLLPATTMHRYTHTHTEACLTVGTITLLRGIDRGLKEKVERMRSRKRLTTHTCSLLDHRVAHKYTQTSCRLLIPPT